MKYLFKLLAALALAMAGSQALALPIMPSDCGDGADTDNDNIPDSIKCWTGTETTANEINKVVSMMFSPVTELYRAEDGIEEKLLADSYDTAFSGIEADITYGGIGSSINCPTCYLLVKDSDAAPAWYLFDISLLWDGEEIIKLAGFDGAISQVSIFGGPPGTSVPAPGLLGIMSIGLLLISVMRRLKES